MSAATGTAQLGRFNMQMMASLTTVCKAFNLIPRPSHGVRADV